MAKKKIQCLVEKLGLNPNIPHTFLGTNTQQEELFVPDFWNISSEPAVDPPAPSLELVPLPKPQIKAKPKPPARKKL